MSAQGVNLIRLDAAEREIIRQFAQDYLEDPIDPLKAKICERILLSLESATRSENPDPTDCSICGRMIAAGIANLGTEWIWFCEHCEISVKIEPRSEALSR